MTILGSLAALLCGIGLIASRRQADLEQGEDLGGMFTLAAILPVLFIGIFVAVGTGIAGLTLGGRPRRAAAAALAIAAIAIGRTLVAWLA